jgi:hypothetical protein
MPTQDHNAMRAMRPALVAAACGLVATFAVNAIVALASAAPQVGDIVAFAPSATELSGGSTRLVAHRQGRSDCVLDLGVLRRSGGSLVVDTRLVGDAGGFRVHWAGARTSDDLRNCGGDVDLIVDHDDLDTLALAAGGYGVGRKRIPGVTGDLGTIGN